MVAIPQPSLRDLKNARRVFEENEPRDLFYRAATELVELALQGKTSLTPTEAVAVLLQTWNRSYYRFHRFDQRHFKALDRLISRHLPRLLALRSEYIEDLEDARLNELGCLFGDFEKELGRIGAPKCLHLFAPRLFPLWDNKIAKAYGISLGRQGTNAESYLKMLKISRSQARRLLDRGFDGNPLKALDEYNYCRFTNKWM